MSYSEIAESRVNTYREHNSRCRTCRFANADSYSWICKAKQTRYSGRLSETRIRGIFCKLYEARKIDERWYE